MVNLDNSVGNKAYHYHWGKYFGDVLDAVASGQALVVHSMNSENVHGYCSGTRRLNCKQCSY